MTPAQKLLLDSKQSVEEIHKKSGVSKRTIHRIMKGEVRQPNSNTRARLGMAYGVDPNSLITPDAPLSISHLDRPKITLLASAFRIAISHSLQSADDVIRGFSGGPVQTSEDKITSLSPDEDPTRTIDFETSTAIHETLDRLLAYNAFAKGFHLISEEEGYTDRYIASGEDPDIVLFVDSADDTAKAERGLGGTSLISAYQLGVGWIVAAIGDFSRHTLYWREGNTERDPSLAMQLRLDPRDVLIPPSRNWEEPCGRPFAMIPNGRTELQGAAVNMYTGHPPRLETTLQMGDCLLRVMGPSASVFSEGGSRGPLLVAEGWFDASVEVVKGFRPLDCIPGAFIAAGSRAVVRELPSGNRMSFGVNEHFEETLQKFMDTSDNALFDALRQKFLVAATDELADAIVAAL